MLINYLRIEPLPAKEIQRPPDKHLQGRHDRMLRIIQLDPVPFYQKLEGRLDHYQRNNWFLTEHIFPYREDGICRCGCGQKARKFWATDACSMYAYEIKNIICYGTKHARPYIELYYGSECIDCKGWGCDIDHVVPVKHGGGACWLNNFVPRCHNCHRRKTCQDFGWGGFKGAGPNQIKMF